jgi:hypothetical protein
MKKETQEFIFKQSVNLLIKGAINQGVDLVDVAYWLKDLNYDYQVEVIKEVEGGEEEKINNLS